MYIRKQGNICQAVIPYEGREISFFMDTYENRRAVIAWLDELIENGEKRSDVVSLFKGATPKAVLFSVNNETDRIELEFTERLYLEINIFIRNTHISKTSPKPVLEFGAYEPPDQVATRLINLVQSYNYREIEEKLGKLLPQGKYRPFFGETSIELIDKPIPKGFLEWKDREYYEDRMISLIPKLSDYDLKWLNGILEWKEVEKGELDHD